MLAERLRKFEETEKLERLEKSQRNISDIKSVGDPNNSTGGMSLYPYKNKKTIACIQRFPKVNQGMPHYRS